MHRYFVFLFILSAIIYTATSQEDTENEIPIDESLEDNDEVIDRVIDDEIVERVDDKNVNNEDDSSDVIDDDDDRDFGRLTLEETFHHSVQAYLENDFTECIAGFRNVIKRYKEYRNATTTCRTKCRENVADFSPFLPEDIEDLYFFEKKVRETLCLLNCNQDYRDVAGSQALKRLSRETEQKIMDLKPYEYLHICYYQKNRFQDAANAIYTYLIRHPKHEMSVKNLRYYLTLTEVKDTDVVNLEAAPFVNFYIHGVKAYEEEFYEEAADEFEKSLKAYMKSEEECRIYCEGSFDQGWLPEFTSSVANHFAYCLKCKRSCSQYLNNINGEYEKDLLASHYNYLQFAYYKLGDLENACAATESYLAFFPADETMINNKEYYSKLPKFQSDYFQARPEALMYVKRQEYELRILRFISDEFAAIDARLAVAKNLADEMKRDYERENVGKDQQHVNLPSSKFMGGNWTLKTYVEPWRESQINEALENVKIIANERELGGKLRYLAEGLILQSECNSLLQLTKAAAVEGDGYENNKSPHSKYEIFKGLTVGRVALMVYFGLLGPEQLELFLHSSELARSHVEKYFNLNRTLYFSYTHLVCRSAVPDAPSDQNIFSHDVHADNCLAIKEGTCLHEKPAFTWRDYSAIIYLNDDFEGGEFIFAADPKARKIQSEVHPRCGRMVAFSADGENLHGVKGVRKGCRCALALWFTMDRRYIEVERRLAQIILDRVNFRGPIMNEKNITIPRYYEKMLHKSFKDDETLKLLLTLS